MLIRNSYYLESTTDNQKVQSNREQLLEKAEPSTPISQITIDKIGLQIEIPDAINNEARKRYHNPYLTIMYYGPHCSRILVHAEFRPDVKNHGLKCAYAIFELEQHGIFSEQISHYIRASLAIVLQNKRQFDSSFAPAFLRAIFKLVEWETAFDFYHIPPISYYSPETFHTVGHTIYSNDNRAGTGKGDGRDSFLKAYPRHEHDKRVWLLPYEVYRIEFLHEKDNAQDLTWGLLNGDTLHAFHLLLPSITRLMHRIAKPEDLIFSGFWIQHAPPWFKDFLASTRWLEEVTNEKRPPRRPKRYLA